MVSTIKIRSVGATNSIIVPDDYPTIQEAINAANPLDTIFVRSGIYYEHIIVNKTLTLVGENSETTIVDGNGGGTVFALETFNVIITGFTIQNGEDGVGLVDFGNSTVFLNILKNNGQGVNIEDSAHNNVSYNVFEHNGVAIIVWSTSWEPGTETPSNYNAIVGNHIKCDYIDDDGIFLDAATHSLISDNIVRARSRPSLGYGISIGECDWSILRNNTISDFRVPFSWGDAFGIKSYDIDTSNTINGKPIYYLTNQTNLKINPLTFPNVGYLILIDSKDIVVENLSFSYTVEDPWGKTPVVSDICLVNTKGSEIKNVDGFRIRLSTGDNTTIHDNVNTEISIGGSFNNISQNLNVSIYLGRGQRNVVSKNIINGDCLWMGADVSWQRGISLAYSSRNTISENVIRNCWKGVDLGWSSDHNTMVGNTIVNNHFGFYTDTSALPENNTIYHNNFVDNEDQVSIPLGMQGNHWDNGSEGNYWSDYNGTDNDADGIGDTPYIIDPDNQDNYPLISPTIPIARSFTTHSLQIEIYSNSSISSFQFNSSSKQLSFNITGPTGTNGFCNVTIPENLLWGDFSVYKDGSLLAEGVDYNQSYNGIHYTFYITYIHSTHTIQIIGTEAIPEFPSFFILLLFMIATLLAVIISKRKRRGACVCALGTNGEKDY